MELSIHHDKIINTFARLKSREATRASDAGEDREEIGQLIDKTGLNKKALSFVRSIDKMEDDKRQDVLRSLAPLLDLMNKHWDGQSTPDMFSEAVDPEDEDDDDTFVPADDAEDDEGDPEIAAEADEFEAHLAQVSEAAE